MRNIAKETRYAGWKALFSGMSALAAARPASGKPAAEHEPARMVRVAVKRSRALPIFGGLVALLVGLLLVSQLVNSPWWSRIESIPAQLSAWASKPAPVPVVAPSEAPATPDVAVVHPDVTQAPSVPVGAPLTCSGSSSSALDAGPQNIANALGAMTDGALGKALAIMMLLMGGALAVAKGTPMPALTGVMGAAFLSFGPRIILSVLGCA